MILVFMEHREGKVKKSSLETLSEGKRRADELGLEVCAVLIGHEVDNLASETLPYGAAKVFVLENSLLSRYSSSGYAQALFTLAEEVKPKILLFSATAMGKDLAPRCAAKMGVSMASECTGTAVQNGSLTFIRPIYAGKAFITVGLSGIPQVATLRPNVFPLVEAQQNGGEIVKKEVAIGENQIKAQLEEIVRQEGSELDVTEAEIIISGGRGMKGAENFDLLRDLSKLLPHSAVGASRSAVDSGWIDHQHQVGQTGKTVSPNLYLAIGISGAIQHLAGMSSSKKIVAVNKDHEAPIFKVADFGVVGDLFQILPPFKEELKKVLSE